MYYKIPLTWIGNDFLTGDPHDLKNGQAEDYDLLYELDQQKYYPIKASDLPGNLVDRHNYTNLRVFANYNEVVFCAMGQKGEMA